MWALFTTGLTFLCKRSVYNSIAKMRYYLSVIKLKEVNTMNLDNRTALKVATGIWGGALLVCAAEILHSKLTRYDSEGFDKDGYNREGYNRQGFNAEGYNRKGYSIDGFDKYGYDELGFDCYGYDHQGYTADGYNKDGLDRRGFNREGYDAEGYDRFGRDSEGYYRNGYDLSGFNREGYDRQGYGRDRYSAAGFDRAGRSATQYINLLGKLNIRLNDAQRQLDIGEFRYAVNDARLVMEEVLRLVVEHNEGAENAGDCLLENLKICEHKNLLLVENVFIDRLHGVRHICNEVTHELDASERLTHQKTYFVIMQTRDLLRSAEKTLCCA